jgi:hypothetical protein
MKTVRWKHEPKEPAQPFICFSTPEENALNFWPTTARPVTVIHEYADSRCTDAFERAARFTINLPPVRLNPLRKRWRRRVRWYLGHVRHGPGVRVRGLLSWTSKQTQAKRARNGRVVRESESAAGKRPKWRGKKRLQVHDSTRVPFCHLHFGKGYPSRAITTILIFQLMRPDPSDGRRLKAR